jgi:AraC family L-rhamnose operon regulatory protein RhaS
VERHFLEPLKLEDLAAKAGMSVNGFLRVFRRLHGTSPIAYAQRLRLSHARKLLREGGLSVTEVAFESGFADSNCFSRCYRKGSGEPPTATRRRR